MLILAYYGVSNIVKNHLFCAIFINHFWELAVISNKPDFKGCLKKEVFMSFLSTPEQLPFLCDVYNVF